MENSRIELIIGGGLARWNYERLSVIGTLLTADRPIEDLVAPLKSPNLEISPVLKGYSRRFLAAICFKPLINIEMIQFPTLETSLVLYSLQAKTSEELAKQFASCRGFNLIGSDRCFVQAIQERIESVEVPNYFQMDYLSKRDGCSLDSLFGACRYENFLRTYKDMKDDAVTLAARKKFGVCF